MARFALVEQPPATPDVPQAFILLREIAARLHGQIKDKTRAINRLHNLVSRVFPELATIAPKLDAAWILDLLDRYSSPKRIAAARLDLVTKIAYLKFDVAKAVHEAAARSVASFSGEFAERLIRELIRDIRQCQIGEKTLEKMLSEAFEGLPQSGHRQIITIPGIGPGTAAVLVAKMVSIERLSSPEKIVGYFGIFPEERSSGVDRKGRHITPGTMVMSHKGCDLVRRYLWNAAKSAIVITRREFMHDSDAQCNTRHAPMRCRFFICARTGQL